MMRTLCWIVLCACTSRATVLGPDGSGKDTSGDDTSSNGDGTSGATGDTSGTGAMNMGGCATISCASGTHCLAADSGAKCVCDAQSGDTFYADSVNGSLTSADIVPTGNSDPAACRFKQLAGAIAAAAAALPESGRLQVKATGYVDTPIVFAEAISVPARIDLDTTDTGITPQNYVISLTGTADTLVALAGDSTLAGFTLSLDGGSASSTLLTTCATGTNAITVTHVAITGATATGVHLLNACATTLSDVHVANATGSGILADAATVTLQESSASTNTTGLSVLSGTVTATDSVFDTNTVDGVHVVAGSFSLTGSSHADHNGANGLREDAGSVALSGSGGAQLSLSHNAAAGLQLGEGSASATAFTGTALLLDQNLQGVIVNKADDGGVASLSNSTISASTGTTDGQASVHVHKSIVCTMCPSLYSFILASNTISGGVRGFLGGDIVTGGATFEEVAASISDNTFTGASKIGVKLRLAATGQVSFTGNAIWKNAAAPLSGTPGDGCTGNGNDPKIGGVCITGAVPAGWSYSGNKHYANGATQMGVGLPSGTLSLAGTCGTAQPFNQFYCYTRGSTDFAVFVRSTSLTLDLTGTTFLSASPVYNTTPSADTDVSHPSSGDGSSVTLASACLDSGVCPP